MTWARRMAVALILMLVCQPLAGCWDRREVSSIAFALAMGVSRAPNGDFMVTVEIPIPRKVKAGGGGGGGGGMGGGGSGGTEAPALVRTSQGKTIFSALEKLTASLGRTVTFGHCSVILIKEDVASDGGLVDVLDFLTRSYQFRRQSVMLVTARDPVEILAAASPELEATTAQNLAKTIEDLSRDASLGYVATVREVMERQSVLGAHTAIGRVDIESDPTGEKSSVIEGLSTFEQSRIVGTLNSEETFGVNLVLNRVHSAVLAFDVPPLPPDATASPTPSYHGAQKEGASASTSAVGAAVTCHITGADADVSARLEGGAPAITVKVKVTAHIAELGLPLSLDKPEVMAALRTAFAKKIESAVRAAITKTQSFPTPTDIFWFSEAIHDRFMKYWVQVRDNWHEIYKTLKVDIVVDARITQTGLSLNPPVPHK